MYTIKGMIDNTIDIDETQLINLSDKLWEIGSLAEIKEKTSPELFCVHVAGNMIGNWQGEGWWGVICEHADLVPYIPETLDKLNLPELKMAFENVIEIFPEYTVFSSNNALYYDICNFLQSFSIKVEDERLNSIPKDERRELVKQVRKNIDKLENLTEPLFGNGAELEGWKVIVDYIQKNME